jgi:hypothetical protein
MSVGFSTVNTVNAWLNVLRGTSAATFTGVTTLFVQLHTADPGSAGTTAVSSVTTRPALNYSAASGGSQTSTGTPSWATWAGTNGEVVTHVSVWSASSAGTFYYSVALAASKTVNTGDTLNLTAVTVSIAPLAA